MASNKIVTLGPFVLTATTTVNIFGPPSFTLSGGANIPPPATTWISYYILRHFHVANTTAAAIRFALWKTSTGANTAGKEFIAAGTATAGALDANVGMSIAANSVYDWYGLARIQSDETDKFIVGGASAVGLTIQGEAEVGIA